MNHDLFVGITSWNSQLFLPSCLQALKRTTRTANIQVCVLDNLSQDHSAQIARDNGADVIVRSCSQPEALNILIRRSKATYTLLIHADVIVLNNSWFQLCLSKLVDKVVLVSPEDIGCGPLTRPFGVNKPESSFMLFKTDALKNSRSLKWRKKRGIPLPRYEFDFSGGHVTHNIPQLLKTRGMSWYPMRVHPSNKGREPFYIPTVQPTIWSEELSYLQYGLGNFYSIDGIITHYHNWYDRVATSVRPQAANKPNSKEFPADFINQYSSRFLSDYHSDQVDLPDDLSTSRTPRAL